MRGRRRRGGRRLRRVEGAGYLTRGEGQRGVGDVPEGRVQGWAYGYKFGHEYKYEFQPSDLLTSPLAPITPPSRPCASRPGATRPYQPPYLLLPLPTYPKPHITTSAPSLHHPIPRTQTPHLPLPPIPHTTIPPPTSPSHPPPPPRPRSATQLTNPPPPSTSTKSTTPKQRTRGLPLPTISALLRALLALSVGRGIEHPATHVGAVFKAGRLVGVTSATPGAVDWRRRGLSKREACWRVGDGCGGGFGCEDWACVGKGGGEWDGMTWLVGGSADGIVCGVLGLRLVGDAGLEAGMGG